MEVLFGDDGLLAGDPVEIAPRLLGATITSRVNSVDGAAVSIRLTEVEAYCGQIDPGSHAFHGPTPRNASMFQAAGCIYVYFVYGMHHCVNIVCGPPGQAGAVLLRAGQVTAGVDTARSRRPAATADRDLARGPARLCAALGLGRANDGMRLGAGEDPLVLTLPAPGERVDEAIIRSGPRTGLAGPGGDGTRFPWRFWIDGDPTVSPYRPAARRPRRRA